VIAAEEHERCVKLVQQMNPEAAWKLSKRRP